jgi:membrane-associated phospholipid phosphatase
VNAARPLALGVARGAVLFATLAAVVTVRSTAPATTLFGVVLVAVGLVWLFEGGASSVRAWAGYLGAFAVFAYLRRLTDETGLAVHVDYPIEFDRFLGAGHVPTVWLQQTLYTPGTVGPIVVAASLVYASYFIVPHVVAFVLWKRDRARFGRYVFEILGTAYLGVIVSAMAPTSPPWLAAQDGALPFVARIFHDALNGFDPDVYRQGYEVVGVNPVAAMPSLHMALTFVVAMTALRAGRRVGVVASAYAVAMGFSLVYLGEHYVIDVLAGVAFALVVSVVGSVVFRREAGAQVSKR